MEAIQQVIRIKTRGTGISHSHQQERNLQVIIEAISQPQSRRPKCQDTCR